MGTSSFDPQPVIVTTLTPDTPPDQAHESLLLLAQAQLPVTVEVDGQAVHYHPLVAGVLPQPLGAADAAVLHAYGELPSLAQLMRAQALAFQSWQVARTGPSGAVGGAWEVVELEFSYLVLQAVVLDIASLRDGGDPRTAHECLLAANQLRELAGLEQAGEREARAWLRFAYAREAAARVPVSAQGAGAAPAGRQPGE
ncbi:hypothetical protein [Kitasatospora griseola]|uniref:hypothetical protein n=1 Tax=Kitasatospora griseola TaxID=2064 RepID=UPI003412FF01